MGEFGQITHTHMYAVPFHTRKVFTTLRVNSSSFSGRTVPLFDSMLVHQGEGSGTLTKPHHTPSPESPQSPQHDLSSSIHPLVTTATIPTVLLLITPYLGNTPGELGLLSPQLFLLLQMSLHLLWGMTVKSSLETGDEAGVDKSTERGSNDTEDLVNVLTSLDAASILTSKVQMVNVPPVAEVPTVSVPTGSGMVPTASLIFTTASVVTPYSRRKGKEKMLVKEDQRMNEQIFRDAEIARIHVEEELQMLIDSLDRNNETVAKYLQEYEQFVEDLSIEERIELINDLVKYQDNYAKVLKEYLNQLWTLVKETLSIRQATNDKEKELWVDLKRLYEPDVEDQPWTQTQALMHDPVE
uniref:Uncharacterized protein n=1 Tax=Tanacetum cinerariifolium TaxID=118510 RepID=A0A699L802_TANCI|nr:hypothetical protein [Tanacetum cinerariifolium]